MRVYKRKYRDGRIVWRYLFDAPGSTRENRIIIEKSGFATRKEAQEAEAARRIEVQRAYQTAKAGAGLTAAVPFTLGTLLEEFIAQHARQKLAPKTAERYREQIGYLDPGLLAMPLAEIMPLHLRREWGRLLKSGGHTRTQQKPRPLSPKTVRHIAGMVSSAFSRDQVGTGLHQPGILRCATAGEKASRDGAYGSAVAGGDGCSVRAVVHANVPRASHHGCSARRTTRTAVGGHR